ncbi:helix-turn-helix transcriptional regulator [Cohnella nanjingensis]|uniref:Helix-turn-helix transcriptional regulator n=2 Tax=Cohnella nanjingensis TaxID=1387779 RepID=A0A7X0RLD1_9BACL|nr:helix-turn-helix transcriptional regulator [Cohnella nanjingensis]
MTQEMLALRSGLDRSYIGSVERGERNIAFLNIVAICNAFDVNLAYFFEDERFPIAPASLKRTYLNPLSEKFAYESDEEQRVLAWQIKGGITVRELSDIGSTLKKACLRLSREGKVKLLIDFRDMLADGQPFVNRPDVMDRWENLQHWAVPYCEKVVVLCNSKLMQNQFDRQGRRSGIFDRKNCLFEPDRQLLIEQSYHLLGIHGNKLVEKG